MGRVGTPKAAKGRWTFLFYIDADNNLEADELEDLTRVAAAHASGDIKVLALVDRSPDDTTHVFGPNDVAPDANLGSIPNFTDAKLIQVDNGGFKELKDLGEIDMGDPQTWAWFLMTGMQMFPAEHYAAEINDHGGGIDGAAWDDSSDQSNLSMADIVAGINAALTTTHEDKLDVMAFSACLMAHVDMAAKLAPFVNYLIASEEETVSRQWDDTAFIKAAIDNRNATGADLGKAVVDGIDRTVGDYPERTMATIDLTKMGAVTQALTSFATAAKASITQTAAPMGRAQVASLHFGKGASKDGDVYSMYDIGDFVAHLQGVPDAVQTSANALWAAEKSAVLSKAGGSAAQTMTGMSLYFPANAHDFRSDYGQEAVVHEWVDALLAYTGGPGATSNGVALDTFTLDIRPDGVVATAKLFPGTAGFLVGATLFSGRVQPNGDVHFLVMAPGTINYTEPVLVSSAWNFYSLQVTDGTKALDGTTTLYAIGGGLLAAIEMIYQRADGSQYSAQLMFTFDPASGAIIDPPQVIVFNGAGGASVLVGEPGSLLAPLVLVAPSGAGPSYALITDQALDATQPINVAPVRMPAGSTFIEVMVIDDTADNAAIGQASDLVP
jgi:hypothetical protein